MSKCLLCNKKIKIHRSCPVLNTEICSTCCGTKRNNEIKCTRDCSYFIESIIKENKRNIMKLVKESFNEIYPDLFQEQKVLDVVGPFEVFLLESYYNNREVNDEFLFECFMKMYYFLEGKGEIYIYKDDESKIFDEFNKIAVDTNTDIELQKRILLRLMKSVEQMTGGIFGNRMYFELLRGQFTSTGITANMFNIE
jgi:hypothetical protein